MPQPIPFRENAAGFRSFPKVILERPELAALIGAIAAEWGYIDDALVRIYDLALGDRNPHQHAVNPVHVAVLETLGALGPRLDIIERVLKLRIPEPVPGEFVNLRVKIRHSAGERARYVHASWSISEDFPNDLVITAGSGNTRYQKHDFEQALDRAVALRTEVHRFIVKVGHAPRLNP